MSNQINDWELASNRQLNSWELREGYIHAHGVLLHALGILGNQLINDKASWKALNELSNIDWSRGSDNWKGRAVVNGRITKSINNVKLTKNQIKNLIGIQLTTSEKFIEKEFKAS